MKNPFHYTICGLDYIYLENGFDIADTAYGPAVRVLQATKLDRVIALFVVRRQSRMTGQEVHFLRGLLDLTQAGLARALGEDAEVVAGWEESTARIPLASDLAIRRLYLKRMGTK